MTHRSSRTQFLTLVNESTSVMSYTSSAPNKEPASQPHRHIQTQPQETRQQKRPGTTAMPVDGVRGASTKSGFGGGEGGTHRLRLCNKSARGHCTAPGQPCPAPHPQIHQACQPPARNSGNVCMPPCARMCPASQCSSIHCLSLTFYCLSLPERCVAMAGNAVESAGKQVRASRAVGQCCCGCRCFLSH